jgi:hypothetical protein
VVCCVPCRDLTAPMLRWATLWVGVQVEAQAFVLPCFTSSAVKATPQGVSAGVGGGDGDAAATFSSSGRSVLVVVERRWCDHPHARTHTRTHESVARRCIQILNTLTQGRVGIWWGQSNRYHVSCGQLVWHASYGGNAMALQGARGRSGRRGDRGGDGTSRPPRCWGRDSLLSSYSAATRQPRGEGHDPCGGLRP